tara:strand:+ start:730 stop:972 length:243 start_codon:yes stop_codon:yes gene_type:complete
MAMELSILQLKYPNLGISVLSIGRGKMIKPINPIAKALAHNRKRKAIVPNKKTVYNKNREKINAQKFYISEDSNKEKASD